MPQLPDNKDQIAADEAKRLSENAEAVIGTSDDITPTPETVPPKQDQDEAETGVIKREPIPRSPSDDIRGQIAARFRRAAPENERPFNNDMSDPENIYGEVGAAEQTLSDEEIDARAAEREKAPPPVDPGAEDPEVEPGDETRMITRIVRGKKTTLSEREWLDRGAQVTAADSYLAEAREKMRIANEIRRQSSAPDRQHPDGETGAQDDGLEAPRAEAEVQQPELTARDVVQKIQYGDPDEAAADFDRLVDQRVNKIAVEGQLRRAYEQDHDRSQAALRAFEQKYPDIVADKYATKAIETGLYDLYAEDIKALGVKPEEIPPDTATIANWHRWYRTRGYGVRNTADLLEASRVLLDKWRGGTPTDNQPPSRRAAPNVQINVQRDERRMAIPNQPTRAAVPRRDAQIPQKLTGSDIVANMRRARGQI